MEPAEVSCRGHTKNCFTSEISKSDTHEALKLSPISTTTPLGYRQTLLNCSAFFASPWKRFFPELRIAKPDGLANSINMLAYRQSFYGRTTAFINYHLLHRAPAKIEFASSGNERAVMTQVSRSTNKELYSEIMVTFALPQRYRKSVKWRCEGSMRPSMFLSYVDPWMQLHELIRSQLSAFIELHLVHSAQVAVELSKMQVHIYRSHVRMPASSTSAASI